jgi:cytochrome c biogenesis protein CcmG, thiol:disulfide interchange protein DsbE
MTSRPASSETSRQAIWTLGTVVAIAALFAFVIFPYLRPKSALDGRDATDFALPVIHGGEAGSRIRLKDLRGKAVVLDFWASWCIPCQKQAPILETVARKYEQGGEVVVVGVNTSDEQEPAIEFARRHALTYAMVFDEGNRVAAAYSVTGLPTLVVVGRSGRIVAVRRSVVREKELEELVGQALGG